MSALQDRLQAALGDAYRIQRELGGGGMSRVFVAEDAELGRRVVIKVLPPEVAAGVNIDRFRREIRLVASLQHPHIVPLLAAGHAAELLWYTMPLIEGESLRTKLAREGALPIADAVKILRDVADALAYAHTHGVAHRDIKPDNVLTSGHHAVVTDFGVAKALSESTGQSSLTSAGVALGTPAYMAPEQAAADPHADHRCDLYAVGALAYEMLTGRPPFTGNTPQQVLAAHVSERPAPVTKHRETVPPALAEGVMRCLEKNPADRFQTADELLHLLEAMATPSGGTQPVAAVRRPAARWLRVAGVGAVVAVLVLGVVLWRQRAGGHAAVPIDRNVVAVLPFRVTGSDPSLAYLREGMVDLLAAKLTGEGGPRAVDPRTAIAAWRQAGASGDADLTQDAALRVARRLGAGQLLLGEVVGTPSRLVLNAAVLALAEGRTRAQGSVQGPSDSLPALVDGLAAQLLALHAGEVQQRLGAMTSTSLPALRAYLEGQAASRRGRYRDAIDQFQRALTLDSTFALAGMSLWGAAVWISDFEAQGRGLRLAWAHRDRLSARDRTILIGYAGPRYPELSSNLEGLAAWERAVAVAPDQPEAWWELGDWLFHRAQVLGLEAAHERAADAFRRAVALDSTFAGPLGHLVDLAALAGDTAGVRRLGALYVAADSAADIADFVRWRIAVALGDSGALRALRARFDQMGAASLERILGTMQLDGIALEDVDRVAAALRRKATKPVDRSLAMDLLRTVALNRGRPREALASAEAFRDVLPSARQYLRVLVSDAFFGDGDSSAAAQAVRHLAGWADAPLARDQPERVEQYHDLCLVNLWRAALRDFRTATRAIALLRAATVPQDTVGMAAYGALCAAMIEAMVAAAEGRGDAGPVLERLESLMLTGPPLDRPVLGVPNLVVARLREARRDYSEALAATRRRPYDWNGIAYLSSFLREEGRLAALTGDREGAMRAYRHYLALRSDPEPSLKPEVDRVRAELARLVGEHR